MRGYTKINGNMVIDEWDGDKLTLRYNDRWQFYFDVDKEQFNAKDSPLKRRYITNFLIDFCGISEATNGKTN